MAAPVTLIIDDAAFPMDLSAIQLAVTSRLPRRARWLTPDGTPLDFTFYAVPRRLSDLLAEEGCDGAVDGAEDFTGFGECDYAEGGGARPWLVVGNVDSRVYAIDIESERPIELLNSTLAGFVETFRLLHNDLGAGRLLSPGVGRSAEQLDPESYPNSEWAHLVEYFTAL
jgi:hypothetical protein